MYGHVLVSLIVLINRSSQVAFRADALLLQQQREWRNGLERQRLCDGIIDTTKCAPVLAISRVRKVCDAPASSITHVRKSLQEEEERCRAEQACSVVDGVA